MSKHAILLSLIFASACSPTFVRPREEDGGSTKDTAKEEQQHDGGVPMASDDDDDDEGVDDEPVMGKSKDASKEPPAEEADDPASEVDEKDAGSAPAKTNPDAAPPKEEEPPVKADPPSPTDEELCKVCSDNATCTVSGGKPVCKCNEKYVGDGKKCSFDSKCSTLDCGANTQCVADESTDTLRCECLKGYTDVFLLGCLDVDDACDDNPCTDPNKPKCTDKVDGFDCACLPASESSNLIINPDFSVGVSPWRDRASMTAHLSENGGVGQITVPDSQYNDFLQEVTLEIGATYSLTADITSGANDAWAANCSYGLRASSNNATAFADEFPNNVAQHLPTIQGVVAEAKNWVFFGCWGRQSGDPNTLKLDNVVLKRVSGVCK